MTSRQLVDFVERKLKQHGIRKVIPNGDTWREPTQCLPRVIDCLEAFDELKEKLEDESERARSKRPRILRPRSKSCSNNIPTSLASGGPTAHRSRRARDDEDDEDDDDAEDEDGDEDLSDIAE